VHGICGIWGTLSLGLFACGQYGATGPLGADNSAPLTGLFFDSTFGGRFPISRWLWRRQTNNYESGTGADDSLYDLFY
jgi:hypothetical protein